MRKIFVTGLWAMMLASAWIPAMGQTSREEILSEPAKAGGLMYVYDYKADPVMTPAPKGYKPVYVSHYGRHGARWAVDFQYDTVFNVLNRAAAAGMLTPRGEALHKAYSAFYDEVRYREGELTAVGMDQQRTIARRMVRRFPEVFKGETRGGAISTPVPRVIMSMVSFIDGLRSVDKDIEVERDASESFSPILRPNWSRLDVKRPLTMKEICAPYEDYFLESVDMDGILGRIFTNPAQAVERCHIRTIDFVRYLFVAASGEQCLDAPSDRFDGLFTPEDAIAVARGEGYRVFRFLGRYAGSGSLYPDFAAYTLKDIIDKAESDISSGEMQLRLRFSHDSSVMPLAVFMNVNGFGREAGTPEEAFEIFPLWRMPMAGGLQFIFYRSRKSPEMLVKVLWNEAEARLPIEAYEGPYYRWSDFKAYYGDLISRSLAKIDRLR